MQSLWFSFSTLENCACCCLIRSFDSELHGLPYEISISRDDSDIVYRYSNLTNCRYSMRSLFCDFDTTRTIRRKKERERVHIRTFCRLLFFFFVLPISTFVALIRIDFFYSRVVPFTVCSDSFSPVSLHFMMISIIIYIKCEKFGKRKSTEENLRFDFVFKCKCMEKRSRIEAIY